MMNIARRRWGDNDVNIGSFTFALDAKYRHFAIIVSSGDNEGSSASFRISAFGGTAILALPRWLVPTEKKKVFPPLSSWDEATIKRLGRDWYWAETRRAYGISLYEGHFSLNYGRQTHDSSTEQSWGCFLPWTQWRHVRHSLYGMSGEHFADMPQRARGLHLGDPGFNDHWDRGQAIEDACPAAVFAFKDYDGEELTVTAKIKEHEWLLGEGWFKWLSAFGRPKIQRSLDLRFSGETGRRKGSWKSGTIGHGIGMLPGELHEAAFVRYCAENNMTFQRRVT